MATWGPMSLSEPLLEPVTQSFFMAEVPNSSHAVFLHASWEGLALQAAVHSRVFPRVPHDLGAGHGGGVVRKREVVENSTKSGNYYSIGYSSCTQQTTLGKESSRDFFNPLLICEQVYVSSVCLSLMRI